MAMKKIQIKGSGKNMRGIFKITRHGKKITRHGNLKIQSIMIIYWRWNIMKNIETIGQKLNCERNYES